MLNNPYDLTGHMDQADTTPVLHAHPTVILSQQQANGLVRSLNALRAVEAVAKNRTLHAALGALAFGIETARGYVAMPDAKPADKTKEPDTATENAGAYESKGAERSALKAADTATKPAEKKSPGKDRPRAAS